MARNFLPKILNSSSVCVLLCAALDTYIHDTQKKCPDGLHFPDPKAMQHQLGAKGRHLVCITDPHIKRDRALWTSLSTPLRILHL